MKKILFLFAIIINFLLIYNSSFAECVGFIKHISYQPSRIDGEGVCNSSFGTDHKTLSYELDYQCIQNWKENHIITSEEVMYKSVSVSNLTLNEACTGRGKIFRISTPFSSEHPNQNNNPIFIPLPGF